MKVYIAGALSSKESAERTPTQVVVDYIANITKMCRIAGQIRKKGFAPFVPALDFLLGAINGDWTEDDYRGLGMEFLDICDAMLVISFSWGVEQEIKRAKELCIPIYYSLEELYGQTRQGTSCAEEGISARALIFHPTLSR